MRPISLFCLVTCLFFCSIAFAQVDPNIIPIDPDVGAVQVVTVTEQENTICVSEDICLSGVSASIAIWFSLAVTFASFLVKLFRDKTTWYGKILHKVAEIRIKTKK